MQCSLQQKETERSWKKREKKNCQTVRTIYGSRKKNCKKKKKKKNVASQMLENWMWQLEGCGEREGGYIAGGNMCVPLVAWTAAAAHMCAQCVGLRVLTCHSRERPLSPPCPFNKSCSAFVALHFCFSCRVAAPGTNEMKTEKCKLYN